MTYTWCRLILIPALVLALPAEAAKPARKAQPAAASKVEIVLSHTFGQAAEAELQKLVDRFNARNPGGEVKLARHGTADKPSVLNILRRTQVAEFVADKRGFLPLHAVIRRSGERINAADLSADLKAGVTDDKGRLLALPVAYSTPVLFYNKSAFRKAKLDPEQPPQTWDDVQEIAGKLLAAGYDCPYTSSWPTWVHIDNLSALSGESISNAKGDLVFNGMMQVKHVAKLATWKSAGYYHPFGRRNEADEKFGEGRCVMLTTDSWAHTEFREAQGVELGVAPLPHHEGLFGGRQHTLADGPSLWIGSGYQPAEYKVAARFVGFLLTPEIQVQLASIYGHLPLTQAARAAMKSQSLRDRTQTLDIAYAGLKGSGASHPLRVSAIDPVRQILDAELEKVWEGNASPKEALDIAVTRGNVILKAQPALRRYQPQ